MDDWLAHCALSEHAIERFGNDIIGQIRFRFTELIYQPVGRVIGTVLLDDAYEFDAWVAQTNGQAYWYWNELGKLEVRRWCGLRNVS